MASRIAAGIETLANPRVAAQARRFFKAHEKVSFVRGRTEAPVVANIVTRGDAADEHGEPLKQVASGLNAVRHSV